MDGRCPRKLSEYPGSFCPLAVQRLKALRHAGRELTEEEEALLPGCRWAISHQMANYCFFKYIDECLPDARDLSDMEIAHSLNISIDTLKKTEKKALEKLRGNEIIEEIREIYGDDSVVTQNDLGSVEYDLPRK
jgi:hypothetical protein